MFQNSYNKALQSLEKYPLPIFSSYQAQSIDGIGPKIASQIFKLQTQFYAEYYSSDVIHESLRLETLSSSKKSSSKRSASNSKSRVLSPKAPQSASKQLPSLPRSISFTSIADNFHPEKTPAPSFTVSPSSLASVGLTLLVDSRERVSTLPSYFPKMLKNLGVNVETAPLPLGDFLWRLTLSKKEGDADHIPSLLLPIIVERKTASDLTSSIIDGRYKDQQMRLRMLDFRSTIYLLECSQPPPSSTTCYLRVFHKFKILRTKSEEHTLLALKNAYLSIKTAINSSILLNKPITAKIESSFSTSTNRKSSSTVSKIWSYMLSSVKGIGSQRARKVAQIVGSVREMVEVINGFGNGDGEEGLRKLELLKAALGPKLWEKTLEFFTID